MRAVASIVAAATILAGAGEAAAQATPIPRLRFNGYVDVPVTAALLSIYGFSELAVKARLAPRAPYWDDRDTNGADILAPSWGTSGVTVSSALGTPKGSSSATKLRVTMALQATTDRGRAPTLVNWRQSIECIPAE